MLAEPNASSAKHPKVLVWNVYPSLLKVYAIQPHQIHDAYIINSYFRWFRLKEEFQLSPASFTAFFCDKHSILLSKVLSDHGQRSFVSITAFVFVLGNFLLLLLCQMFWQDTNENPYIYFVMLDLSLPLFASLSYILIKVYDRVIWDVTWFFFLLLKRQCDHIWDCNERLWLRFFIISRTTARLFWKLLFQTPYQSAHEYVRGRGKANTKERGTKLRNLLCKTLHYSAVSFGVVKIMISCIG